MGSSYVRVRYEVVVYVATKNARHARPQQVRRKEGSWALWRDIWDDQGGHDPFYLLSTNCIGMGCVVHS